MFMRFRGGGVGHRSTRVYTDIFLRDKHPVDVSIEENAPDEEMEVDEPEDGDQASPELGESMDEIEDEEDEEDEEGDPSKHEATEDALGPEDGEDADEEEGEYDYAVL
jgi:hypothetical protein